MSEKTNKKVQEEKFKKCFEQQYTLCFWRHVDDNGIEDGEIFYGTYRNAKRYFERKYAPMAFFTDGKGYLY